MLFESEDCFKSLDDFVLHSACLDTPLVIAFSDISYLEITLNWIVAIERVSVENYLIVALDVETFQFLNEKNLPTVAMFLDDTNRELELPWLTRLWELRLHVFQYLAYAECDFIHSDVDAVWLQNPIEDLLLREDYDLLFSSGTNYPLETARKLGFVACCGFFYVKASNSVGKLFEDIATASTISGDDQVGLNRVLSNSDFGWIVSQGVYHLRKVSHFLDKTDDGKFLCSRQTIPGFSDAYNLRVGILPHHLVQRIPQNNTDVYLKHPLASRDLEHRISTLAENGCWFLSGKWKSSCFNRSNILSLCNRQVDS